MSRRPSSVRTPQRGDVWEVNLQPIVGAEVGKDRRRVVVIGADGLSPLALRIVVPVTTRQPNHAGKPWLVEIAERPPVFTKRVSVDCYQIRCLSTERFLSFCGTITPAEDEAILDGVALCLDIPLIET